MTTKLNVLVYSGAGTTTESVRHCLYTLRRLLSPYYAVTPVNGETLIKEPWTSNCALLCIPGGADLGFCKALDGEGNRKIIQFVRRGGAYIGFCAGGYYASGRCEFEIGNRSMEVVGNRELRFFPGVCRGCAYKGFVYDSESGAKAAYLRPHSLEGIAGGLIHKFRAYYNGGGVFADADKYRNEGVEILASYVDDLDVESGEGKAAVIYCKVGEGAALLTGSHPEFASVNLDRNHGDARYTRLVDDLTADDHIRIQFLTACLKKLGLRVNTESDEVPSLSELHLTSNGAMSVAKIVEKLQEITTSEDGINVVVGENDTFVFEEAGSISKHLSSEEEANTAGGVPDYNKIPKHVKLHDAGYPAPRETPWFNHEIYYNSLRIAQARSEKDVSFFGSSILYGSVVTSTSTMLDKNFKLIQRLPTGLTAVGTVQLAGRGRGSNQWVSPIGSLMFSTIVRHHWQLGEHAPVVFVQYLVALAIVEAVKTYGPGYTDMPVRLKWPNDIYAEDPRETTVKHGKSFVKIGGIMVNSSYANNEYILVVGCGVNTTNTAPTTSLNHILKALNVKRAERYLPPLDHFQQEILLAKIMVVFEEMYQKFSRQGFVPFEKLYYQHWLHTDQIVTLEMEGGVRARVRGITMEDGLLKVDELNDQARETGRKYTLQTDNNSFDFFKGLLKKKV